MVSNIPWYIKLLVLTLAVLFIAGFYNLENTPPSWWDESWTLNVERNGVELGHYGHLIDGQPRGPGLIAAFPVVVTRTAGTDEFVNMRENRYSFACGNPDKLTNALIEFSNNRDMAC